MYVVFWKINPLWNSSWSLRHPKSYAATEISVVRGICQLLPAVVRVVFRLPHNGLTCQIQKHIKMSSPVMQCHLNQPVPFNHKACSFAWLWDVNWCCSNKRYSSLKWPRWNDTTARAFRTDSFSCSLSHCGSDQRKRPRRSILPACCNTWGSNMNAHFIFKTNAPARSNDGNNPIRQ